MEPGGRLETCADAATPTAGERSTLPSRTGRRAEVAFERDGLTTRRIPEPTSTDATHEEYVVDCGDGERILALRTQRLKQQLGPGYEIRGTVTPVTLPPDMAQIEVSIPLDLWPRFGAKLGLAFGALALGEYWTRSSWADWLRARLHGQAAEAPDPRVVLRSLPIPPGADDTLPLLTDRPNHTIFLMGSEPATLMIHLFGVWCYLVPLGPSTSADGPAWKFDSVRGRAEQTTFDALVLDAITRLDGGNAA